MYPFGVKKTRIGAVKTTVANTINPCINPSGKAKNTSYQTNPHQLTKQFALNHPGCEAKYTQLEIFGKSITYGKVIGYLKPYSVGLPPQENAVFLRNDSAKDVWELSALKNEFELTVEIVDPKVQGYVVFDINLLEMLCQHTKQIVEAVSLWNGSCSRCGKGTYTGLFQMEHEGGSCG